MAKERKKKIKTKHSVPMFLKMCLPMILLVVLQITSFIGILIFSGEFSTIKQYAYNTLSEKADNRTTYIENTLNSKTQLVYESAEKVNAIVGKILQNDNKRITDIQRDKQLNKKIVSSSADTIVSLLRRDMVNDAFIILDSGNLYKENDTKRLTGFYIRDNDPSENSGDNNEDLFLEMGASQTAHDMGITLDYEWSLYLNATEDIDMDFFNTPISAYKNTQTEVYNLGYWSSISCISPSAEKSIKYSMPLVSDNGTVYGVIGIGMLEKDIQKSIPSNDFLNNSACYILATDLDNNGEYSTQIHSGSAYSRLISDDTVFSNENENQYGLYSYNTKVDSVGTINSINIYSKDSPFKGQNWVLISVADSSEILGIYHKLMGISFVSSAVFLVFGILFAIFLSNRVTKPVSRMIKTLKKDTNAEELVQFDSSGISEIDTLCESIEYLQVNVREQAFRVSNILSVADTGIGVFMYDLQDGSVFVGKSLIKILGFSDISGDSDVTISFDRFKSYLMEIDEENHIFDMSIFSDKFDKSKKFEVNLDICVHQKKIDTVKWLRFTLTRENNNVIGLVQDITQIVIERKKLEHERDFDITTGLYNRRAFYQRVNDLFCRPEKLGVGAFMMIDLDNLKFVNDTYGHDFGDDYIKTAADVLRTLEGYNAIVSRLSGDEFLVFIYGGKSKEEIRDLIYQTQEKMKNSYCILADGSHYRIRASGGYSWYPDDSQSYDALIKYADFAMYSIKHTTKGNIAEFDKNMYKNDSILVTGIEELNRIIENNDIKFAFQPIVNAKTGEIYGYEALMRPQSEVFPSVLEFIRVAKSSAKLYEIERLTWFVGLQNYVEQIKKGNIAADARLFINSIANCILDERSINLISQQYKDYLHNIMLEILEGEQSNNEYSERKKRLAKEWDMKLALDDFGTGYNSEYALITINPYLIKIDRSIITDCDSDVEKRTIIENLVNVSKKKNIKVLAEGVETFGEMKTCYNCGVDFFQGYYFARPDYEPKGISDKSKEALKKLIKK